MTAMNQEDFTAALNNKLDEARASLNKDFFKKFASGQLQMESMKGYVGIVYHECQYFLRLISLIHAKAERKKAREILGANLCEEYANGDIENNHPALQLKFAASLGLDPVAIEQMERPKIYEEYFADYWNLAENSFIEGLAMLSFHEHDLTKRFIRMRDALLEHYGASRDDLQYYEEHISEDSPITDPEFPGYGGDEVHVARQVQVLAMSATTEEEQQSVLNAIDIAAAARTKLNIALDAAYGATIAPGTTPTQEQPSARA